MVRTALLSVAAGAVIAADWLRLEDPRGPLGAVAALVALASAAALAG